MIHFPAPRRFLALLVSIAGASLSSAQILSVDNTNDSGPGSFRQAVLDSQTFSTATVPVVTIDFQAVQAAAAPARAEIVMTSTAVWLYRPVYLVAAGNLPKPSLSISFNNTLSSVLRIGPNIDGTVTLQNLRFEGARKQGLAGGAALYHVDTGTGTNSLVLQLEGCEFVENRSTGANDFGGAIAFQNTTNGTGTALEIRNCLFEGNRCGDLTPTDPSTPSGSAVYSQGANVVIEDTVFRNNFCGSNRPGSGGALFINGGRSPAIFRRCLFEGNDGFQGVGVALIQPFGTTLPGGAVFESSLFKNNSGSTAVSLTDTDANGASSAGFDNCTFVGNTGNNGIPGGGDASALSMGAGFGSLDLRNCTVWNNRHFTAEGSAIRFPGDGSPIQISQTVIAGNLPASATQSATQSATRSADISRQGTGSGNVTSGGYNFIGDATGQETSFNITGDTIGTNASPLDPKLAGPADFGGPTETCPPLPGSPLIDAIPSGSTLLATDQIGTTRPQGNFTDIGAVELPRVPFSSWNQQIPDTLKRNPTDDADSDGLNNLLEYYFGTDPNQPNQAPVNVLTNESGTFLEVIRSSSVRPAAFTNAGIQTSTTLESNDWQPLPDPAMESSPLTPGDISRIRSLFIMDTETDPVRFFRAIAE